ncbi:hypothetical protein [Rhodoplanes roseus]|uniref:hypothetical protein n=1 Tax=Rhodoplanes roseus TaxID=29409 RepID=UPI001473CDC1|nr:hypothetical protein [Rhodoplanes roseus]
MDILAVTRTTMPIRGPAVFAGAQTPVRWHRSIGSLCPDKEAFRAMRYESSVATARRLT